VVAAAAYRTCNRWTTFIRSTYSTALLLQLTKRTDCWTIGIQHHPRWCGRQQQQQHQQRQHARISTSSIQHIRSMTTALSSEDAPDVALVWNCARAVANTSTRLRQPTGIETPLHVSVSDSEPTIHVSLQPTSTQTVTLTTDSVPTPCDGGGAVIPHPNPHQSTDRTGNSEDDNNNNNNSNNNSNSNSNSNDLIPDAVLTYERQLRKAQHANKTCRSLTEHDLVVVFVDEYIVVVDKPAGVLTVPGLNHNPSMLDLVHLKYGSQVTDPVHMIVHRLDMDTSGLVLFARTLEIAKKMHSIFRDREISKHYECLIMGHLHLQPKEFDTTATKVIVDLPLQRDHEHPPFMRVSTPQSEQAAMACVDQLQQHGWKKILRKAAKPSQSILHVVEHGVYQTDVTSNENDGNNDPTLPHLSLPYTRLRLEPITGRTHQLRVHWCVLVFFLQSYLISYDLSNQRRQEKLTRPLIPKMHAVPL
jgi:23S rRNA-/tRNA-specific pseudouridylate synthase